MIWNTNTGRLAARHCFTMFYASDIFAPKCTIDGKSAREWLQGHYNAAYAQYVTTVPMPHHTLASASSILVWFGAELGRC